jgi:hypothetical protein
MGSFLENTVYVSVDECDLEDIHPVMARRLETFRSLPSVLL